MDLFHAKAYTAAAATKLREKAGEQAMDTAAGQLILAMGALLDALEKEPQNYTGVSPLLKKLSQEVDEAWPQDKYQGILHEVPGVYSGHINPADGGTSPYRHWQSEKLREASFIIDTLSNRGVLTP